jgi:hypothetical protein
MLRHSDVVPQSSSNVSDSMGVLAVSIREEVAGFDDCNNACECDSRCEDEAEGPIECDIEDEERSNKARSIFSLLLSVVFCYEYDAMKKLQNFTPCALYLWTIVQSLSSMQKRKMQDFESSNDSIAFATAIYNR